MQHSTTTPTVAQAARMAAISAGGCLACYIGQVHLWGGPVEVHHLLSGGLRMGHDYTIGLCRWHHQGVSLRGSDRSTMELIYGPSFAHSSRKFHANYGSDMELLTMQNERLGLPAPVIVRKRRGNTASPSKMLPRSL